MRGSGGDYEKRRLVPLNKRKNHCTKSQNPDPFLNLTRLPLSGGPADAVSSQVPTLDPRIARETTSSSRPESLPARRAVSPPSAPLAALGLRGLHCGSSGQGIFPFFFEAAEPSASQQTTRRHLTVGLRSRQRDI
ncbi:uncharacterized protein VTP21DRAFT_8342 [Calcarisporiella thermophila]|uniref:uncharacterized protein n=1 Tax=Calcarisporiella thermophila TaxID=911321 RepID=UPI0037442214